MTRIGRAYVLFLACLLGCADSVTATRTMVVLDAEPTVRSRVQKLEVVVRGFADRRGVDDREALDRTFLAPAGELEWPTMIAVTPKDRDATRLYEVVATGSDENGIVAQARAISGYVEHKLLALPLVLEDGCIGMICTMDDQTCRGGVCVSAEIDAVTLMQFRESDYPKAELVQFGADDGGPSGSEPADGGATGGTGGTGSGGSGTGGSGTGGGGGTDAGTGGTGAAASLDGGAGKDAAMPTPECPLGAFFESTKGLCWQADVVATQVSFVQAATRCPSPWRVPTIEEVIALMRGCDQSACGVSDPGCLGSSCGSACAMCAFRGGPGPNGCYWDALLPGACDLCYWSSSTDGGTAHWSVLFTSGSVRSTGSNCLVRCVTAPM